MALLSIRDVTRRFGESWRSTRSRSTSSVAEIVGLIGPNGAGKTTLFNVITRLYKPDSGELEFDGKSLLRTPPHRVVRRGIARTFQNVELFKSMSVLDNVLVGAHTSTQPFRRNSSDERALDDPGVRRIADRPAPARGRASVRDAEARRARARTRRRAASALARRAGGRAQPRRGLRASARSSRRCATTSTSPSSSSSITSGS